MKSNRASGSAMPLCRSVGKKEIVLFKTGSSGVTPDTDMGTLVSSQSFAALKCSKCNQIE